MAVLIQRVESEYTNGDGMTKNPMIDEDVLYEKCKGIIFKKYSMRRGEPYGSKIQQEILSMMYPELKEKH